MTNRIAILMCSRHLRFDKVRIAREQVLAGEGQAHYMRGGKPGYFPSLKKNIPHPIPLDFWDPLGFTKKMSDEKKAASLRAEVNNGRLAMLGIMAFLSEAKVRDLSLKCGLLQQRTIRGADW